MTVGGGGDGLSQSDAMVVRGTKDLNQGEGNERRKQGREKLDLKRLEGYQWSTGRD